MPVVTFALVYFLVGSHALAPDSGETATVHGLTRDRCVAMLQDEATYHKGHKEPEEMARGFRFNTDARYWADCVPERP